MGHFPNSYALVLCGGQSSRMGTDKSMLIYHQKPQRYHVYDMLQPLCEKAFISCKHSRISTIEHGYSYLADDHRYHDTGPIAALLTAFEKFPQKNILLVGCDYPFLTTGDLELLALHCKENKAAAFYTDVYEPLVAWYPYSLHSDLKEKFSSGQQSLKHFLEETEAEKVKALTTKSIVSIDTREEYEKVVHG